MNEELEQQLVEKYPGILRDWKGDPRQTCMAWGIAIGNGWYELIDNACHDVTELIGKRDVKFIADQIKEKFGGLRFYYHLEKNQTILEWFEWKVMNPLMINRFWKGGREYNKIKDFRKKYLFKSLREKISDIVDHAEILSYQTCEVCGQPGKRSGGGWIQTLCEKCDKQD